METAHQIPRANEEVMRSGTDSEHPAGAANDVLGQDQDRDYGPAGFGFELPDTSSLEWASVEAQIGDDSELDSLVLSELSLENDATIDQSEWAAVNEYYWRTHAGACLVCKRHYAQYGIHLVE
jgi:hypothetical protein